MTSYETLAIAYFIVVAATGSRSAHRVRGWSYVAAAVGLVIVARFVPWPVRVWMPHAYLVLGYWIPATFTPEPRNEKFELWLRNNFRVPSSQFQRFQGLELAYFLCYPLVPVAFGVVWLLGAPADADRFWVAVLLAAYSCYVTLPWTAARPPRSRDASARTGVAALNAYVLRRFSHNLITFPSGHVAVSVAAALAVGQVSPGAGVLFGVMALAIAVAAVTGRYHYRVDVWLGAIVGLLAVLIACLRPQ